MATDTATNARKGQHIEIEIDGAWVVGRVNSTPVYHAGRVGFSVWTPRHEGVFVQVDEAHPIRVIG